MITSKKRKSFGFTIVELLVVIVIIGILAAITIVAYTGISQRATIAGLQSDLASAATKLKMYYAEYGVYPDSPLSDSYCPTGAVNPADAKYCLKASTGNTFTYTSTSPYHSFTLDANNTASSIAYRITESTGPTLISFVTATGGTITYTDSNGLNPRPSPSYPGGYTLQTFTNTGTLTVTNNGTADILIVAGGGGGADGGGGGGGVIQASNVSLSGTMPVVVGTGGTGGLNYSGGSNGLNSTFAGFSAIGGGQGAYSSYPGIAGASGGGGSAFSTAGGAGTPGQGFAGGQGSQYGGGGGGGAGGIGGLGGYTSTFNDYEYNRIYYPGDGGPGLKISISGNNVGYSGGGGGGGMYGTQSVASDGGGGCTGTVAGTPGTANTGGGGGGGAQESGQGGNGGSGIVVIRYLSQ
ncbi:MAG TPA: prepilin-type N-terminal cleavage/methylation domain-containing protein [Candidatus Saccharimonadales bacterium]|nr:prepilin-type N-terminal cleavage/methylation domain-containing protein [Candidatus Saccharimonadales bacterium]